MSSTTIKTLDNRMETVDTLETAYADNIAIAVTASKVENRNVFNSIQGLWKKSRLRLSETWKDFLTSMYVLPITIFLPLVLIALGNLPLLWEGRSLWEITQGDGNGIDYWLSMALNLPGFTYMTFIILAITLDKKIEEVFQKREKNSEDFKNNVSGAILISFIVTMFTSGALLFNTPLSKNSILGIGTSSLANRGFLMKLNGSTKDTDYFLNQDGKVFVVNQIINRDASFMSDNTPQLGPLLDVGSMTWKLKPTDHESTNVSTRSGGENASICLNKTNTAMDIHEKNLGADDHSTVYNVCMNVSRTKGNLEFGGNVVGYIYYLGQQGKPYGGDERGKESSSLKEDLRIISKLGDGEISYQPPKESK